MVIKLLPIMFQKAPGGALWWLAPLLLTSILGNAQPPEPAPASPPASIAPSPAQPESLLEDIEARRAQLAQEINRIQQALNVARDDRGTQQRALLGQQVDVLQQLDALYAQQVSALQNAKTLTAEERQYREGLEKLTGPIPTESVTFTELERKREELDGLATRESALDAKRKQSVTLLEQAQADLKEQENKLSQVEQAMSEDPEAALAKLRLELARRAAELARETVKLRQIEMDNAVQAQAVYAAQRKFLERQIHLLEQHVTFSKKELNAQLQDIETNEFNLKRELSKASQQQSMTHGRLVEARARLEKAPPDQQQMAAEEVDGKRLADEAAKVRADALTRRIELLAEWKTIWKRRHAVFNDQQKHSQWLKWKREATDSIDAIDQEERLITLWLNDWQNQLISVKNKLASLSESDIGVSRWIELQRESVEKIISVYQEQHAFLENTRRLQNKLIDEITERMAHRTWREWLRLALDYELYGNSVGHWMGAAGSAIGLFALLLLIRNTLMARLQVHAEADEARVAAQFFASVRRTTAFFLLMISIFLSAFWLSLAPSTDATLKHLTMIALIFQGAVWLSYFLSAWIRSYLGARAKRDAASKGALSIFNFVSQAAVWSIALLLILQNLGIDVTALATGLGIGGVAVALAVQRILGDLFSSLSIVLDKPFVAGDFIVVDQILGTVEHIGIKTTRIRSLDGEQIICANSDLLGTRIRNFQRMRERRVVFQVGVVYQTPTRQLTRIPEILREVVNSQAHARCDRAHFKSFGDFALSYEVVYFVDSPDYNLYMDIQQAINLAIFQRFEAEGIDFAYPTQSLYLQGPSRQPADGHPEHLAEGLASHVESAA